MSNSTEFPTTKENRVPANKGRRYPPEVLVPGEVHALLEACSINPRTELRNRALITVLYRAGLRCSDAPAASPKDAGFRSVPIRALHGKGDRPLTVGIDSDALVIVRRFPLAAWERLNWPGGADR
jgi:site-specific recombinase XerD